MSDKTIFIDALDSIGDIVVKLGNAKSEEITLVVPRGAILLQSLVNLKLLASQADRLAKKLTLSTESGLAENLAREAGINIIETLTPRRIEKITLTSENPPADDIAEVSDPSPDLDEPAFRRTQLEVTDYQEPGDDTKITPTTLLSTWREKLPSIRMPRLPQFNFRLEPHHRVAAAVALGGLLILASVSYFIVPRAYAALEVPSEPYQKQFSLVVADETDLQAAGPNLLTGRFIEVVREHTASFEATGEKNRGLTATGKITIVNTTGSIAGLLANTRFQSPTGLVYRINNEILVPPAQGSRAGRAIVDAVADEGGAKYNLATGTRMTIPGLGEAAQASVYGEVTGAFSGGTDDIVKVVSEDDVNRAKDEAAQNVFASVEVDFNKLLKRGESIPQGFIQNEIIDALPSVSIGTEQANFDVRLQSRSWTLAIKKGQLEDALKNAADFEAPEGRQVTPKTLETAKIEVLESSFLIHRINLVVSLNGQIGPRLDLSDITENIANQPKGQAESYLGGIENVTGASLEVWPSFIPRVPMLHGNIRTKVIYTGES